MILDLRFSVAETWPQVELMGVQELEAFTPNYQPDLSDEELDSMTVGEAQRIVGGVAVLARRQRRRDEAAGLVAISQSERKKQDDDTTNAGG